jgi:predicted AlkP superfamily pyrophosphatase or phosphodiesterase
MMKNVLTAKPQRVIELIIDGLHWKAPEKLRMPVFNALVAEGVYIQRSYMIVPHHPTVGDYGKVHSSSFPNPVLQEGNLFISPQNKMLQELFSPEAVTAFIANTRAYVSVSRGFTINIHNQQLSDAEVVKESIALLHQNDIAYFRIHLQTPGNEGRYLSYTTPDKAYYRNIWGNQSPYVQAIEAADVLLGELIADLKKTDKWDSTLLVVTSDHGQSETGWHPMIDEDSVMTPLLFTGPSVAQNRKLEYFEHTDITPTIAGIMGIEKKAVNSGGAGIFIREVLAEEQGDTWKHPRYIQTINRQLNAYNALRARIMIAGETDTYFSSLISYLENELLTPEPFYHQDRFLEWYKAGSTQHLINVNDHILQQMKKELSDRNAAGKAVW